MEVKEHEPYVMSLNNRGYGRLHLGTWVECECGWVGPGRSSEAKALETHKFHAWLCTTYPLGKGLEVKQLRAKCWVLADVATGEHVSPKAPCTWASKQTASHALRILKAGYGT